MLRGYAIRYTDEFGVSYLGPRLYLDREEGREAVHCAAVKHVAGRKVEPSCQAIIARVQLVPVVSDDGVLREVKRG